MNRWWIQPDRLPVLMIALICGVIFVTAMTWWLDAGSSAATLLLDYHAKEPPNYPFTYPFTVQNFMHMLMFAGFGEVYCRWRITQREVKMIHAGMLPESYEVVLQAHDLAPIRKQVANRYDGEHGFLPSLIDLCILQFQSGRSVDQTVSVLNSSLELIAHRVDLRYSMLRYVVWLIPTIGFIGTVIGISLALKMIDPNAVEQPLGEIAQALGLSFYTTLVALGESAILVLLLNIVQAREERVVNDAGYYTLKNLINRLYAGG